MATVELNGAAIEMNKNAFGSGALAAIDPDPVFEAAGIVRNAPTAAESTPGALQSLPPGEWESTEWGATAAPKSARAEDELRHLPAHADASLLPPGEGVAQRRRREGE